MTTDVKTTAWFDRFLPSSLHAWARLARWDRPVGFWLLYWPCAWGLLLSPGFRNFSFAEQFYWLALFLVGAVAMRGAGCTINDLWDRHLDKEVERTAARPLASGAVSVKGAFIFLGLQCCVGFGVWLCLPFGAMLLSLLYVPLIIIYPLMKRITYWPQAFLAVVFNAGVPIGWLATDSSLDWLTLWTYLVAMAWTLGYDTLYAHMDHRDDMRVGIKSTVVALGERAVDLIVVCWWLVCGGWAIIAMTQDFGLFSWFIGGFAFVLQTLRFMLWDPENDVLTLGYFKAQHWFGGMLALACWYNVLQHMVGTG